MEIWKPLRDFPNYNASSEGRIMNVRTQRILKTKFDEKGYEHVCLRKNNRPYTLRVHKLIAETFIGLYPGLDVRHKDLNRSNNRADNLYWTSRSETVCDAYQRGSKRPSHISAIRVIETGDIYPSVTECAKVLECSRANIHKQLDGAIDHVKQLHFERL